MKLTLLKKLGLLSSLSIAAGTAAMAAPATAATTASCGLHVTSNFTLTEDIGPCPHGGLVVDADNITINLNSFRIFGTPKVGDGVGVDITGHTGFTLQYGTISDFDAGVAITGGSANIVQGVTATHNVGSGNGDFGDGISLFATNGNIIRNNEVSFNGPFDGIGLIGSTTFNNTIQNNMVNDNNTRTLPGGPYQDDGIRLEPGTHDNQITGNTVLRSGLDGIALFFQSHDNAVVKNFVSANGFHPPLVNRPGDGIHVFFAADNSKIQNNTVTDNAGNGIVVSSRNNLIRLNTATGNGNGGGFVVGPLFDLKDTNPACDANNWNRNVFNTRSQTCIH